MNDSYYDPPEPPISAIETIDNWQYKNKITDDELWAIFEMGRAALTALRAGIPPFDLRWNADPEQPDEPDWMRDRVDWNTQAAVEEAIGLEEQPQ